MTEDTSRPPLGRAGLELDLPTADTHGRAQAVSVLTGLTWGGYWWRRLVLFAILALPFATPRVLRIFQFLYFGHWALIKEFPYLGPPQPRESLRHHYMLYCGNFNGGVSEYVERFMDFMPKGLATIWGGTPGWFPVSPHGDAWIDNLLRHNLSCRYYYSAYPRATINDIRNAVTLETELRGFIVTSQSLDASEFASAYVVFLEHVAPFLGREAHIQVDGQPNDDGTARAWATADATAGARRAAPLPAIGQSEGLATGMRRWFDQVVAGNRAGQHSVVTALCPVRPGEQAALEDVLPRLPRERGPFSKLTQVHFARFGILEPQFFDDALRGRPELVGDAPPPNTDPRLLEPVGLRSSYVLFAAAFDADFEKFARDLAALAPDLDVIWRHCVGYPGTADPRAFAAWLRRCSPRNALVYSDYPDLAVQEVQRLTRIQRQFTRFATRAAGNRPPPDELQAGFWNVVARLLETLPEGGTAR